MITQETTKRYQGGERPPGCPLTLTELAILQLSADGKTCREISIIRGTALSTTELQRQHVLEKLDVGNIAQAISTGFRRGWLV